jgi:hypothetical protein
VLQNVSIVINLWKNIDFLGMESYLCYGLMNSCDSEELFWRYNIIGPENAAGTCSLVGIVHIHRLAEAGRQEDVLESIRNGERTDDGLWGACYGGHKELALLMIQKIESSGIRIIVEFNWGLSAACYGGHEELALLMIRKIESTGRTPDWNWGLGEACRNNHRKLVLLMIEKGATRCYCCKKSLDKH